MNVGKSFYCVLTAMATGLAGVAAAAESTSSGSLQALVNDAVVQLNLSYRNDPAERLERYARMADVIRDWQSAPRSRANNRKLADWLRGMMRTSMPGSRRALPKAPVFAGGPADDRATDPFADDPLP